MNSSNKMNIDDKRDTFASVLTSYDNINRKLSSGLNRSSISLVSDNDISAS